ncbi:MAG: hypothetical protein JNJ45_03040 [Chthonomonas sp.]|nr:hypothetical protein [Chthonomonas sp.]
MLLPGSNGKIHRYDPVNSVYMGSFGLGSSSTDLEVNPSNGTVLALRGGSTAIYDYSSGERLAFNASFGLSKYSMYNSAAGNFDVLYASSSSSFLDTITPSSAAYNAGPNIGVANVQSFMRFGTNSGFGLSITAGQVNFHTWATIGFTSTQSGPTLSSITRVSQLVRSGATSAYYVSQTASSASVQIVLGLGGTPSQFVAANLSGYDFTSAIHIVAHHTGFYAVGRDASVSEYRITDLGLTPSLGLTTVSTTTLSGIGYSSARPGMVLAPEPSSMVAIAFGALLLRRRK